MSLFLVVSWLWVYFVGCLGKCVVSVTVSRVMALSLSLESLLKPCAILGRVTTRHRQPRDVVCVVAVGCGRVASAARSAHLEAKDTNVTPDQTGKRGDNVTPMQSATATTLMRVQSSKFQKANKGLKCRNLRKANQTFKKSLESEGRANHKFPPSIFHNLSLVHSCLLLHSVYDVSWCFMMFHVSSHVINVQSGTS